MTMTNQDKSNEPVYRQLQLIHERYFRDVADAWADSQSQCRNIQTEFERGIERAYQSQQPEQFRVAQDEYQQKVQSLYSNPTLPQQYAEAYDKYKAALKQLIAESDINDLGFTDVRNLGQSLLSVSTTAMNLVGPVSPGAPAASDPFSPPGGAPGAAA
ncbi:hypothetical protein [Bradyrhizobium guangzhouense]|uniref:hypothetical protein n=1 Tax=Bradyrhizobium guangzhouense TaxID=1325095 RepID=UPI001009FD95|nr:hypothetical protein [Bradyrhizobium guangzhouense]RXH11366.1 hypothetical protein EAS54_29280 [Bradyrhizobium guangzhouense]